MERREFLKGVAVLGIASSLQENSMAQTSRQDMPYRELGRTGERVSALGMGGFHIGHPGLSEADSIRLIRSAIDRGINFDTVQMPLNVMDAHIRSFEKLVLPKLVQECVGVLGMKSMGDSIILKSKLVQPIDCLQYAMNLPTSVVITGIDSPQILDQAFEAARTFQPMTKEQVAALLRKTEHAAARGDYELFKTSQNFDSTAHHPEWLGGQSPHVQQLVGPPS